MANVACLRVGEREQILPLGFGKQIMDRPMKMDNG
jgi:hypothetical protein